MLKTKKRLRNIIAIKYVISKVRLHDLTDNRFWYLGTILKLYFQNCWTFLFLLVFLISEFQIRNSILGKILDSILWEEDLYNFIPNWFLLD